MTWRIRARLMAATVIGALALTGVAAADQLIFEPGREIRATGSVRVRTEFLEVTCNVTLEGSFRTGSFERVAGTQVGEVSRTTFSGCSGGNTATALATPWRINYSSITGSYPEEATALGLEVVSAQIQNVEVFTRCLYRGNLRVSFELTPDERLSEAWRLQRATVPSSSLTLVSGSCPATATASGSLTLSAPQQVRRRIGRLAVYAIWMPVGEDRMEFTMTNISPPNEPDARVNTLSLIRRPMTMDAPERFEFVAGENRCPGETLRPNEVNLCVTKVRFRGLPAERPRWATLRVDWNNGVEARSNNFPVEAR